MLKAILKVWNKEVSKFVKESKGIALGKVASWDVREEMAPFFEEEGLVSAEADEEYLRWVMMERLRSGKSQWNYG